MIKSHPYLLLKKRKLSTKNPFFIKKYLISRNRYSFQYLATTNKWLIYHVGMKLEKKNAAIVGDKIYVGTKNHRKRF